MVFDYQLEDIDYQRSGAPIFNGQDSVIWKNIRAAFADELKTMYQNLRSSGALSYEKIEQMFEEHQSKWSEAIFNEDSQFKYIEPFVRDNANYLYMLLGSKEEQRKWWLYNRFRYIDSKYIAGDARSDSIFLRPYAASDITITPYADIYATIAWDATITQSRASRNLPVTLTCPYQTMNGNIVTIYSSSQLASIGDLSALQIGQIDISNATRLQSLKVGSSATGYDNSNLYSMTFGSNVLLKVVDVRNCSGLGDTSLQGHTQTTVDLSGCEIIEEVYFDGTNITGVTLPNGGVLKVLSLPKTITSLIIRNQSKITNFSVEDNDYSNISTLRIENCSSVIPVLDILAEIPTNSRVRLIGFTTSVSSTQDVEDFYDYLDTMRGLDEQGQNVDTAQVSGTITGLDTITGSWLAEMNARYPYITITYNHISSNLYYYNGDTLYYTETINDGGNGVYSGTPTKADSADGHYSYTFSGWSKDNDNTPDSDARQHVVADRSVYACYNSTVKTYTVTWVNNGTTIETDTNVAWGTVPHYDGSTPTKDGQTSVGWLPDPTQPITGNTTFTAQYLPVYTVTFKNDTGTTTLDTQSVVQGQTATYGGTTPVSSEDPSLAWLGWATSANAHNADAVLTNVQSDMTVYAAFESGVEVAEITDSWDTIIANIDNGTYSTKYKIGNYKPLDLGTEGIIDMQIAAIDADELADGSGHAPLTFIGRQLLATLRSITDTPLHRPNWDSSNLRRVLSIDIMPLIPDNVRARINSVVKIQSAVEKTQADGDSQVVYQEYQQQTIDKLWIPSRRELFNTSTSVESDGVSYSTLFKDNTSRVKLQYSGSSAIDWHERSSRDVSRYRKVTSSGSGGATDVITTSAGVCLGFCLGLEPETITDDWETILSNPSYANDYSIGDTKYLNLGTEGKHLMEIVAFNEDDKADGNGKANITWLSKDLLNTTHVMNATQKTVDGETAYTAGGWLHSDMRDYLKNTIKPLIPETVRNKIVEVSKVSSTYTDGALVVNGQTTTDDVWIPSNYEIFGTTSYESTGAVYSNKFTDATSRIKKCSGSANLWWLRSAHSASYFRVVDSGGGDNRYDASNARGVALGFCTSVEPDLKYLNYTLDETNQTMTITGLNTANIVADNLESITIPDTINGYHVILGG